MNLTLDVFDSRSLVVKINPPDMHGPWQLVLRAGDTTAPSVCISGLDDADLDRLQAAIHEARVLHARTVAGPEALAIRDGAVGAARPWQNESAPLPRDCDGGLAAERAAMAARGLVPLHPGDGLPL